MYVFVPRDSAIWSSTKKDSIFWLKKAKKKHFSHFWSDPPNWTDSPGIPISNLLMGNSLSHPGKKDTSIKKSKDRQLSTTMEWRLSMLYLWAISGVDAGLVDFQLVYRFWPISGKFSLDSVSTWDCLCVCVSMKDFNLGISGTHLPTWATFHRTTWFGYRDVP